MHDDDRPVGSVVSRRRALAILGGTGAVLTLTGAGIAQGSTPAEAGRTVDCVAKPEAIEGPYFVDEMLNRSDIRSDPSDGSVVEGIPLRLDLQVLQVNGRCAPLRGAQVDIWQCDARGIYSDMAVENTTGKKYLRGYQLTNGAGNVRFTTILPGWYTGRTVHIHIKIRTTGTDGNPYEFTSQLYFTEEFKATYLNTAPYIDEGAPDTTNDTDFIYAEGGDQMVLRPRRLGHGYSANFAIGLDLSDTAVGADDSDTSGGLPPGGTPPPAS
ncbi:protocatechuate 3,4-dioxygenase beta subunit [Amycolatopsis bartoniae]|uniref:Intradiol ring-cleavage dioxygenases domain-containing protein n=1 Tax=Amycolatopsis bartoniae TaxID=941986 RepID=A0A8H9M8J3_9PSEU|nr:twin-arginine translocation pathway signal protein [Amycolatopsis bartoniae]MBB2940226.1 protocatechuate 3,4-dioxygenase beta subunit [Amycolatopsis bartoniae]TVT10185.1 twin-arginine translocation pathway signal protein [Amycolatopsis bartoniae]GHF35064.1 hypothetical protein GCM10017566_04720 [Amycolatopsis bartoniae]